MQNQNRSNDLEERLMRYAGRILKLAEKLPEQRYSRCLANQFLISGMLPVLSFREAFKSEPGGDFYQKIIILLGELMESKEWLMIISQAKLFKSSLLVYLIKETDDLIAGISQELL